MKIKTFYEETRKKSIRKAGKQEFIFCYKKCGRSLPGIATDIKTNSSMRKPGITGIQQ